MEPTGPLLNPSSKNKKRKKEKKNPVKKFLIFSQKRFSYISGNRTF